MGSDLETQLQFRCTEAEKAALIERKKYHGVSLAELLIVSTLGERIRGTKPIAKGESNGGYSKAR